MPERSRTPSPASGTAPSPSATRSSPSASAPAAPRPSSSTGASSSARSRSPRSSRPSSRSSSAPARWWPPARHASRSTTRSWNRPSKVREPALDLRWCAKRPAASGLGRSSASEPERIGLRDPARQLGGESGDGGGLVEPDVFVELPRQDRLEVVALKLGVGPIDDADGALEPRGHQLVPDGVSLRKAQVQEPRRELGAVEEPFVAVGDRRPHP